MTDFNRFFVVLAIFIAFSAQNLFADANEDLLNAARKGDIEAVKSALEAGADVNAKDRQGWTPMLYASQRRMPKIIKILIDNGAEFDKDYKTDDGTTYLTAFIQGCRINLVKEIIEKGADINFVDNSSGLTPLMFAAYYCDTLVDFLISKGATYDKDYKTIDGSTYLMYFSSAGLLKYVQELVEAGADVNAKTDDSGTALIWAAKLGNIEVAKYLVKNGADINAVMSDSSTALLEAIIKDHTTLALWLLSKGAYPNARYDGGTTALISAAVDGNLELVKKLVEKGADIESINKHPFVEGRTALIAASLEGNIDIVKFLISKGADVNAVESDGDTPLSMALSHLDTKMYKNVFSPSRDEIDTKNELLNIAKKTSFELVNILIDAGADINPKAGIDIPIIVAAEEGLLEVVKLLIEKGADVNAKDERGRTALSIADEEGHTEIVEYLKSRGAK